MSVMCAQRSEEARVRAVFEETDVDQSGLLDEEEISALLLKMGRKLSKSERKRAMADMKQQQQQQDGGGRKDQGKGAVVEVNYAEFRAWYMEQDVGQLPCGCHTACAASRDGRV
jgi:transcription initiation factor TFIID subunit TAF12